MKIAIIGLLGSILVAAQCLAADESAEKVISKSFAVEPGGEINVDADPAASDEVVRHVGKRAIPQLVIDGEWFQPYKPGRGLLYDELHVRFGIPKT